MRFFASLPFLALSACCDCVVDTVHITVVDAAGVEADVDAVWFSVDGTEPTEASCRGQEAPCASWYVDFPVAEGGYDFEARTGDVVVGTASAQVDRPRERVGVCCSTVIFEEVVIELD